VITVIPEELAEAKAALGLPVRIEGGTPYYVNALSESGRYDVVLRRLSGRGNIKASTGATELMNDFRPPYILLVGIAGGAKGTKLGDVIVPDFVEGYEMRKLVDGKFRRRMEAYDHPSLRLRHQMAEPLFDDPSWLDHINIGRRPDQAETYPMAFQGNLIAGEKILGCNELEYQRMILDDYENAKAVDMESIGLATAVYEMRATRYYDPQYLVVRGFSDLVHSEHNDDTRDKWRSYAAHTASIFAARVIERILRYG
jgi:nucleoside phosphorylase